MVIDPPVFIRIAKVGQDRAGKFVWQWRRGNHFVPSLVCPGEDPFPVNLGRGAASNRPVDVASVDHPAWIPFRTIAPIHLAEVEPSRARREGTTIGASRPRRRMRS